MPKVSRAISCVATEVSKGRLRAGISVSTTGPDVMWRVAAAAVVAQVVVDWWAEAVPKDVSFSPPGYCGTP